MSEIKKTIWKIKKKETEFSEEILKDYSLAVLNLLKHRDISEKEEIANFLYPDYERDLSDNSFYLEVEKATERIALAKKNQEKIAIFGDYDADGVSASAVLYETFSILGIKNVICYIPDRQTEGYGLNKNALKYLSQKEVNLIITVDCGITGFQETKQAKKLGMDVIITDHHYVPEKLPEALTVINPHIPNSNFSFKDLAGVGVSFKLAQALVKKIDPSKGESLKWILDLVAIGTIADCVPLVGENRVLVKYGLIVLSKTKRSGLLEMFKVGRIDVSENNIPNTQTVSFQIAPRINAAGRMDHANVAYNLLIEKTAILARDMALELEIRNQERQKITAEIAREVEILATNSFKEKKFIFAMSEHWSVGILGLVAGKIMEKFQKPCALFQVQADQLVGSFRSIPQVNIIQLIEKCSDLLIKFGGHSQAAGVSLKKENVEKFYSKMNELIEKEIFGKDIRHFVEIDYQIQPEEIDWNLMNEIKLMEPFGVGNKEPIFLAEKMIVVDCKIVGNGQKHLKLSLRGENKSPKIFDAIGFSLAEKFPHLKKNDKIDIVFNLEEDEWNGNKKMQLKLINLRII
ncbi:MAG: single-stranded-DNA-specific exonuclease RecJ [Candidatus Moranbacteria bacterium CG_4_8_14_3_um_filter_34_16]|nr:MAG: single-stranded-DNA-specific exonuclease RecJ [Candidatus Moranbacteria bacterium CG08_land_8_20_14_0_20_34_16]PIW94896.1 MAG: single-stranded-DNA-specific exonuclease RecJ [Candidatus Moranbacteria bacterium CG_4_8_14_3_um_filter_34_16]PJA89105.1 MAG: single-stranded-DNA-specific exonuclease RecJ [Candidatus Moranbacteria bacterium CG_4_9_14_3_um_filter_33_15]